VTRAGDMVLPPAGRDPVKTQQEWFQELAEHALRHGQSALAAGSLGEALGWLERAHRIGPGDAGLALALATARLRAGQFDAAAKALAALAQRHDRREIWLSLAAARRGQGDDMGAAEALARAFSGHVLPGQATVRRLADAVAEAAGYPGWCGLGDDHQPVLNGPRAGCELRVDGRVHPIWRPVRQGAVRLDVLFDGWAALGSPIDMVALRRVEGVVAVQAGGLEGWAWHPGDPDRDPVLDLRRPDGRLLQQVSAFDTDLPAGGPLARPRRIRVLPDALRHVSGPIHVLGPDGRDLMGSPLEPGAEEAAAAWASRSVSRRFPAVRTREARHPTTPPAPFLPVAATQIGTPAQARPAPDRPVAVVVPVHGNPELTSACLASVFAAMPGGTTVIVVDDASPQAGLMASLDQLQRYGRIQLLRHATNRGFPASANAGMRAAAALAHRPDIVLLNSDTLVADGWLDGLRAAVHAAPDIGTATARVGAPGRAGQSRCRRRHSDGGRLLHVYKAGMHGRGRPVPRGLFRAGIWRGE